MSDEVRRQIDERVAHYLTLMEFGVRQWTPEEVAALRVRALRKKPVLIQGGKSGP